MMLPLDGSGHLRFSGAQASSTHHIAAHPVRTGQRADIVRADRPGRYLRLLGLTVPFRLILVDTQVANARRRTVTLEHCTRDLLYGDHMCQDSPLPRADSRSTVDAQQPQIAILPPQLGRKFIAVADLGPHRAGHGSCAPKAMHHSPQGISHPRQDDFIVAVKTLCSSRIA